MYDTFLTIYLHATAVRQEERLYEALFETGGSACSFCRCDARKEGASSGLKGVSVLGQASAKCIMIFRSCERRP